MLAANLHELRRPEPPMPTMRILPRGICNTRETLVARKAIAGKQKRHWDKRKQQCMKSNETQQMSVMMLMYVCTCVRVIVSGECGNE